MNTHNCPLFYCKHSPDVCYKQRDRDAVIITPTRIYPP